MARTKEEFEFAQMIGTLGERSIAPPLLAGLGIADVRNLNDHRCDHPFADLIGRVNGNYIAVAVRTRVTWEKPRSGAPPRRNGSFNGAGALKIEKARDLIAKDYLIGSGNVIFRWLAIAFDLDDTYEAYWGFPEEMTPVGPTRLGIPMTQAARERYVLSGRRLAWRERWVVPWAKYPGNWTFQARQRWEDLQSITDANERLLRSISECTPSCRKSAGIVAAVPPAVMSTGVPLVGTRNASGGPRGQLNDTRRKMGAQLGSDHPAPICLAVLASLVEARTWTDTERLKELMAMRLNTKGQPWAHKSYYDAANALKDFGLTESKYSENRVLLQITAAGVEFHRLRVGNSK